MRRLACLLADQQNVLHASRVLLHRLRPSVERVVHRQRQRPGLQLDGALSRDRRSPKKRRRFRAGLESLTLCSPFRGAPGSARATPKVASPSTKIHPCHRRTAEEVSASLPLLLKVGNHVVPDVVRHCKLALVCLCVELGISLISDALKYNPKEVANLLLQPSGSGAEVIEEANKQPVWRKDGAPGGVGPDWMGLVGNLRGIQDPADGGPISQVLS